MGWMMTCLFMIICNISYTIKLYYIVAQFYANLLTYIVQKWKFYIAKFIIRYKREMLIYLKCVGNALGYEMLGMVMCSFELILISIYELLYREFRYCV